MTRIISDVVSINLAKLYRVQFQNPEVINSRFQRIPSLNYIASII